MEHKRTYLKDYQPPAYHVLETNLHVDLYEDKAVVGGTLAIELAKMSDDGSWILKKKSNRKSKIQDPKSGVLPPLVLNGENLKLLEVKLNGRVLSPNEYQRTEKALTIRMLDRGSWMVEADQDPRSNNQDPRSVFSLSTLVEIEPHKNTALEGLYKSGSIFCTQNEPEGFRKITYYIDRPDVMAKFTTTIAADKQKYPVLLSNGNPVAAGDLEGGRHFVTWQDPFPKPSYLFALVAGDLGMVEDHFVTRSGRRVVLRFYVDKGNEPKCAHAMDSLKKAMKWDEDTFGFEYDLDIYMIVAVDAFNMAAMENKGLNIFNSQYVLANSKTATDADFENILGVIGHEYFHNWTGNRITCRDWFQLTLKEGLTVLRDQEFSADMTSRGVKRIGDVRVLRDRQFAEDAGPNAHPIRPASYLEINNFYTVTVYEKGAEVIRMIMTLIGRKNFLKGMTKYVELYDGQAVTTEDFVHAMELASGMDLTQFKNWYHRAGTPLCKVRSKYDKKRKTYQLTVEQIQPKTAANRPKTTDGRPKTTDAKKPFYFPLAVGLLDRKGKDIPLILDGDTSKKAVKTKVLHIQKKRQTFVFKKVGGQPVPSLLRDFSAPVRLEYPYTDQELAFLLSHDSDEFNRYNAGFQLAKNRMLDVSSWIMDKKNKRKSAYNIHHPASNILLAAFGALLSDARLDPAFKAEAMILPSVTSLTEAMEVCDFEAAFEARESMMKALAAEHEKKLIEIYRKLHQTGPYSIDPLAIGRRTLKNTVLSYLIALGKPESVTLTWDQFRNATNMTDEIAALALLCHTESEERQKALAGFYGKWQHEFLVVLKWLAVQASSKRREVLAEVRELEKSPAYDVKNPNKIRALIGVFAGNLVRFHDRSGEGYQFLADKILEIDPANPHVASNLSSAFKKFSRLDPVRKRQMKRQLERILACKGLSRNTYEIVSRTLKIKT
jgi:aminopeptidase N